MLARPMVRSADSLQQLLADNLGAEALGHSFRSVAGSAEKFFAHEAAGLPRFSRQGEHLLGSEIERTTTVGVAAKELLAPEAKRLAEFSLQPVEQELAPESAARRIQHMGNNLVPVLRLDHRPLPEPADPERRTSLDDDRPVPSTLERILRRIWH